MVAAKVVPNSLVIAMALLLPFGAACPQVKDKQQASGDCVGRAIPQFADITRSAGIHFEHTSDAEKNYIPESMGGGVLLIDYDGDGWLDIYFTNSPTIDMMHRGLRARSALYRNNHDGTFTDVTAKAGVGYPCAAMGGAVGDYNNDGWPDMYITCIGGNVLYRNNGDGSFTNVAPQAGVVDGRWSTGAAFADYDGDGYLDLMVSNYVDLDLQNLPRPGSASTCTYRGMPVQCGPHGLKGAGDSLFHNNGNGSFTNVSKQTGTSDSAGYYGLGVLWGDFDGSEHPSIFVANDSTPNYLYRNLGHGHFEEIGLQAGVALDEDGKEQANMGVTAGDYLHTGRQSIYSTTFSDEEKPLYRNDGNWEFKDVAESSGLGKRTLPLLGWGTAFADFDNDGWLDLMSVYGHVYPQVNSIRESAGYREPKTLYMNETEGLFCDASTLSGAAIQSASAARGLAVGDLFNDGNIDAVIENIDGSPIVLRNQGVSGRHWIEFALEGTRSNRSAIGAEITLRAGGMTQSEEIRSGGSYLSQSDLRAHFGLASATHADVVEIHWPSGHVDALHNLASDRIYAVLEGSRVVTRTRDLPLKLTPEQPKRATP